MEDIYMQKNKICNIVPRVLQAHLVTASESAEWHLGFK